MHSVFADGDEYPPSPAWRDDESRSRHITHERVRHQYLQYAVSALRCSVGRRVQVVVYGAVGDRQAQRIDRV
jgi:hypothetical protein